MKIGLVALGDTHGRRDWEKVVKQCEADKYVFIGDYFDTHESISPNVQISNFRKILEFKRANPKKVVLIIGNHDYHYVMAQHGEMYSGYSHKYAADIKPLVENAIAAKELQFAYFAKGTLFTHAGVSKTWAAANGISGTGSQVASQINALPLSAFKFHRGDSSGWGNHRAQSCIWVRPTALLDDMVDLKQVVGHTTQTEMTKIGKLTLIDCIGTSGQYLILLKNEGPSSSTVLLAFSHS